ncbi:MAG TPA: hypothetical protein VFG14_17895 [Chthoniobacteraceae bacterium]|nr:hypothetical protein [Chthoniobacteraceae bacterium]
MLVTRTFKRLAVAAFLLIGGFGLRAETLTFADHNFSIEVPTHWSSGKPQPPMIAAYQSADGTKGLMVTAAKLPENERARASGDTQTGMKKGLTDNGWTIESERDGMIGSLPSRVIKARRPSPDSSISVYLTIAGDELYALSFTFGSGISVDDAEAKSIVQSFKLLKPAVVQPMTTETTEPPSTAYRIGYTLGRIGIFLVVPVVLLSVWIVSRALERR